MVSPLATFHSSQLGENRIHSFGQPVPDTSTAAKKKRRVPSGARRESFLTQDRTALAGQAFEEALQLLAPHRVLQLANRFGFDLSYSFAGDLENPTHLLECVGISVAQAIT